ncbi:chemotaxis response regulator protein-glutamate methylesterase [Brucepastera parasyntrophica]|uniref:protein-glutamate methylesterase/protein-glutamine glutaminase n=1 Tax=Brucepastera parasyntrophica TaxID=2880008 RepID=UPI00210DB523|nr:chemotaxis response regulator protein-glutamate methylesterase [Brucepastera parasyntrophica]ULQ61094.1 chemotaxis response regulator protein-glutamate methylesterase [Brucepastera parasyntrophica]
MDKIGVLVVDDSALMRSLIGNIISSSPDLYVVDKAMNGRFALKKLAQIHPDVIILDIEMPEMNGIEFLEARRKLGIEIPVVILSSIAKARAHVTMQCLELGASDFVTKPSGSESLDLHTVANQIIELLYGYGSRYHIKKQSGLIKPLPVDQLRSFGTSLGDMERSFSKIDIEPELDNTAVPAVPEIPQRPRTPHVSHISFPGKDRTQAKPVPVRSPGNIEIIAIGISTGGPNALREVFPHLSPDLPQPIVVVQHMPPSFTEEFANSLNRICPLEVKEAKDGDIVKAGRILIAPGDFHMIVERKPLATTVRITDDPPQNGHRPSVDVLFESIKKNYQNHALAIIMTGMGRDGAAQITELYKEGARTIGQDQNSSIVYGMPRVAYEMGGIMEQLPLSEIASAINRYGMEFRK